MAKAETPRGINQPMTGRAAKFQVHGMIVALALTLAAAVAPQTCAAQDAGQRPVDRADRFLRGEQRGRDILGYVHFGTTYHGHEYLKTLPVNDGHGRQLDGQFALVYRYHWDDDGVSDVAFLCDTRGNVYGVQVMYTNAILNQPFLMADAAIKVLGNLLIGANEDKMSRDERRLVQKLVDDADAKGLLEWALRFQQAFGQ